MFASARDSANGLIHNARRNNSIDRSSEETTTCPHTSRHTVSQRRKLLAHKLPPTDNFCIRPAAVMMWDELIVAHPPALVLSTICSDYLWELDISYYSRRIAKKNKLLVSTYLLLLLYGTHTQYMQVDIKEIINSLDNHWTYSTFI